MNYEFNWFYVKKALPQLMDGLMVTLQLTLWANIIGLVLGFIVAIGMMSRIKLLVWPLTAYIEFFRCTPALIQLVWFFFLRSDPIQCVVECRIYGNPRAGSEPCSVQR